ncbi:MAG: porin family protein [Bacteroidia bacterium]|nr:porin family protein [Bacteroidia bacterium]
MNFKKIALVIALATIGTFGADAQISVGGSLGVNMPVSDFGDSKTGFKTGFGIGLQGRYDLNDNMKVGVNTGYYSFTSQVFDKFTFRIIPVVAVFDYYFMTEGVKPYLGLDLGMYLGQGANDGKTDGIDATNKFGVSPHAGVAYEVNDMIDVFGNVGYNMIFNKDDAKGEKDITYLAVNFGVSYNFNN